MTARLCATILAVTLSACTKAPAEVAPVKDGSILVYTAQLSTLNNVFEYEVKATLTAKGDSEFLLQLDSSRPEPGGPFTVDATLNPSEKIIEAYGLGRLWIPTNSRRQGAITDCGRVDKQRKFKEWDVWELHGRCGKTMGSRYYEVSTGMLVGFQVQYDMKDVSGYLVRSQ